MQVLHHSGVSLCKQLLLTLITVGYLLLSVSSADDYTIQSLGKDFIPISISNSGLIVGKNAVSGAITTQTTANPGNIVSNLGTGNEASRINDSGIVTGYAKTTPTIATLWENSLPSLELTRFSNLIKATAINGFNEIVGTRLDSSSSYRRPFHYDIFSGRLTTLGTLGGAEAWANDVNDNGYMVGSSVDKNGNSRAFRYSSQDAKLTAISPMEGYKHSEGVRINDDESVVGWAYNDTLNQSGKRAFYNRATGSVTNLGTLGRDTDSIARSLNNQNVIIGQSIRADNNGHPFVFSTASTDIVVVIADPTSSNTVYSYSNTGGGILKSIDRGDQWQSANKGLTELKVNALLINPKNSQVLYATTIGESVGKGGLFTSTDGGINWRFLSGKLNGVSVNALDISYNSDGGGERLYVGTNGGIYYSDDKGENWTLADGSTGYSTYNFAHHVTRPNIIYAATSRGVYSSANRGENWSRQNGQGTTQLLSQRVSALVVDPINSNNLYAATIGGGIFKADIAAGSLQWKPFNEGLSNLNVYTLLFYNNNGVSMLFSGSTGGLFQREAASSSWTSASNFGDNRGTYTLALGRDGSGTTLYASTFDGDVFRSISEPSNNLVLASNWKAITSGVSLAEIYALTTISRDSGDANSQTHILAGANNGFFRLSYRSPGDTINWTAPSTGASGMKLTSVVHDSRTTPYTLWAGSSDQGMLISTDNGNNWVFSNEGLDNRNIAAVAIDTTPTVATLFAATMGGVYRSEDGGRRWISASAGLGNSPVYALLLDTSVTPALLYAGTKNGVYRSSDYGRFWVSISNSNSRLKNSEIVTLRQAQNGMLLAGSISGGLFTSVNKGQSWSDSSGPTILPIFDLDEDPFTPDNLLAATDKGLYRLTCTTLCTWNSSPLLTDNTVTAVRFDPNNANHIYAGTEGNGILVSSNLGNSWQARNEGITTTNARMENLNTLLQPTTIRKNWDLQDALDINNNGHIVGWGYYFDDAGVNQGKYGYLLTPVNGTTTVDLKITQTTQPTTVKQGIPFNYHITITNLGPQSETNVKMIDWLPPDITFRVVSSSQGSCLKQPENIIRCELGSIHPNLRPEDNNAVYVNIAMESPFRDIQISNIARVTGNERDSNIENNTISASSNVTVDRCFIATAAYGSFLDPHVTALRTFRDEFLLTHQAGREFVALYYHYSPPLAAIIGDSTILRGITRLLLAPLVYGILYPLTAILLLVTAIAATLLYRRQKGAALNAV